MQRVHLTSVFMYAERHLKEKEKGVEEGVVSKNRATVAHVANAE